MKKIVSLISAVAMFAAISSAAIAAENNPEVYVDGARIFFADQEATIVDSRTLVPARGVFEAMGADVQWNGEERKVLIETNDHKTQVSLIIDDNNMKVTDVMSLFAGALTGQGADVKNVELDVAPQIINDRTMIPLRAISEAIGADVEWNGEAYCVDIRTKDAPTPEKAEKLPTYFLTSSADKVNEGETVVVYVNVKNMPADTYVTGVAAVIEYNSENFKYVGSDMMNGDTIIDGALSDDVPDYTENTVKISHITINKDTAVQSDNVVAKLTFESVNGGKGNFFIVNNYWSDNGFDTDLTTSTTDTAETLKIYEGNALNIDTTPVIVNAEAAE